MSTTASAIDKRTVLAQIMDKSMSAGIGWYGGRAWVNGGNGIQALSTSNAFGASYFVDGTNGSNVNTGLSQADAFATIQAAVDAADPYDTILVAPGGYDESVTLARQTKYGITIVGMGGRHAVGIEPSTAAAVGLTCHARGVTLINMGVAGESTATGACRVTGSAFAAFGCKFEGADTSGYAFGYGPGSDALVTAGTEGKGGDCLLENCEFAWGYDGVALICSDYGAATQVHVAGCYFHNISHTCLMGVPAAFGIGSVRNLRFVSNFLDAMEDGTAPADFINVNDASDTGIVADNYIRLATNASADLKVGAAIFWVSNNTEAGTSVARPS